MWDDWNIPIFSNGISQHFSALLMGEFGKNPPKIQDELKIQGILR